MTIPTSVKRAVDADGSNIATLETALGHAQVTSPVPLAVRYDSSSAPIAYVGQAEPGALLSAAAWRIRRLDLTIGVAMTFADGNGNFDNVWDNRASLSYS